MVGVWGCGGVAATKPGSTRVVPRIVHSQATTTTIDPMVRWLKTVAWNNAGTTTTTVRRGIDAPSVGTSVPTSVALMPSGRGPCGGDLPPCYVCMRESRCTYGAYNPTGCGGRGCYGKWQASGEWACRFGLPCDIAHWTPAQQDYFARVLWNGGKGCSNWAAC